MNININREAAVLIVLFGLIMFANPSMWWLIFVVGPIVMNAMRGGENAGQDNIDRQYRRAETRRQRPPRNEMERRERRDAERRQAAARRDLRSNPTVSVPAARSSTQQRPSKPLSHALEAVQAAGHRPEDMALLPVDIGFIVYRGNEKRVLHREAPITDTVDFIQPYIELYLERPATGTLRFEIVDGAGEVQYVREERHQLRAGRTPISAATRMPVGDFLYTDGDWTLRVYAADHLLAVHTFGWVDADAGAALREHLSEDGELSADLELLIEDARLQPISLDELLSDEGMPAAQTRRM